MKMTSFLIGRDCGGTVALKIIYLIGLINLVKFSTSLKSESVIGRLISSGGFNELSRSSSVSCIGLYGPVCKDCNTRMTCLGEVEPISVHNCEQTYPGRPYCENNLCVSSVSPESVCSPRRRCTADGYFPHPTNCSQYYLCAKAGGTSRLYECPKDYAYNVNENRCTRIATLQQPCAQIDCELNKNRYASYPADNGFYAYCLHSLGVSQPIMFRCTDSYIYKFNVSTQRCEFTCYRTGRIRDYRNCSNYFECFLNDNNEYEYVEESCVNGSTYHIYEQKCIPGGNNQSCEGLVSPGGPY